MGSVARLVLGVKFTGSMSLKRMHWQHIFDSVKASLKRLQLEHIDLLQCECNQVLRVRSVWH